jgi:hypothetical protein
MSWLEKLAERRIQAAAAKGTLSGLAGSGKPLPDRSSDAFVSAGEAVAFRMMAEAGVIPEEIRLKKECDAARLALQGITDPLALQAAQKKLAELEMLRSMAIEARRKFMKN